MSLRLGVTAIKMALLGALAVSQGAFAAESPRTCDGPGAAGCDGVVMSDGSSQLMYGGFGVVGGGMSAGSLALLKANMYPFDGSVRETEILQVAAGQSHTVALKSDGTVVAWGYNGYGQLGDGTTTTRTSPTAVPGLTGVVRIAAGYYHTVALKNDGTVVAWGYNGNGELGDGTTTHRTSPTAVPGLTGVVAVAAGFFHTVALKSDGRVFAWGYNYSGQLGDGTTAQRTSPTAVPGLEGVVAVAAGLYHTVALKSDGTVFAWGYNYSGQLGDGTTAQRTSPTAVTGLTGVVGIAAGAYHTLALKSDGRVFAWGYNPYGQLGDGTTAQRTSPTAVPGLTGVVAVAAGFHHTVALKSDGRVFAWGYNGYGQLGDGTTAQRTIPTEVQGLTGVVAVAAGGNHTVAMKSDGTVVAWGDNGYGQLGDGTTAQRTSPTAVPGLTGVVSVAVGYLHTVALKSDGTVFAWGYSGYGQLGDGTTMQRTSPTAVPGLTGVVVVAAGYLHTVALKSDGTVVAWGNNSSGQLGDGTTAQRTSPTAVPGLEGVVAVAAGLYHTVALKSDGTVFAWGDNGYGQLGDGTTAQRTIPTAVPGLTGVVAVAAGGNHTVAMKSDGTVVAWGNNYSGQLGDGTTAQRTSPTAVPGLEGVVAVAAGGSHTVALKSDGRVFAWGDNRYGQLGDGTTTQRTTPTAVTGLTGVAAVAAGYFHTVAMKSDGTVVAWGDNGYGQLGDGTTTHRTSPTAVAGLEGVVGIAAGYFHTVALKSDGTVFAWGNNVWGQIGDGTAGIHLCPVVVPGIVPSRSQTITVATHAPASAVAGSTFTVAATASSGLPVGISASGACSGAGTGTAGITMAGHRGTCYVTYNQGGNNDFLAAPTVVELTTSADEAAPTSTIAFPMSGASIMAPSYRISGSASDVGSGVDKVEISINGGAWQLASGTTSWSFDWTIPGDGAFTIRSRATDLAGNVETPGGDVTVTAYRRAPSAFAVSGRQLLLGGSPFTVKGVVYSPVPVGVDPLAEEPYGDYFTAEYADIQERDLALLRQMGANAVFIPYWANTADHRAFLDLAYNGGLDPIYVVAGFWVNPGLDIDPASPDNVRDQLKAEFWEMVEAHRNHPAILLWAIGSDLNAEGMYGGDLGSLFSLVDELAGVARTVEGSLSHPVAAGLADVELVGTIAAYDGVVPNLDLWGAAVYRGASFGSLFSDYEAASGRPLLLLGFGIDAYDSEAGAEYESRGAYEQGDSAIDLWNEIAANAGVCAGGAVMEYSDEWWWGGMSADPECVDADPAFHGVCGQPSGAEPDGYLNEEWRGIVRVAANGEVPDLVEPRDAYYALQWLWVPEGVPVKQDAVCVVNGYSGPYDGAAHGASGTCTGVNGEDLSAGLSLGASFTVPPGGTAHWSFSGGRGYNDASGSVAVTIGKASSTVTVSCPPGVVYNGAQQQVCTASVSVAGGLSQALAVSYANNVNAGTATASASYPGDAIHEASSGTATFEIGLAASEVTVSCPPSVAYNGGAQYVCTASVSGVGGLSQVLTVSYTDYTDVGTATASAIYAGGANHAGSSGTATFEIVKTGSVVTVSCPAAAQTYTGSAQEVCTAWVGGVGGLGQALAVSYANNVNAGTATASASYAGDANHEGSSGTATFVIGKAGSEVTLICPPSVAYDGTAQEVCTASVAGVGGLSQALAVSYEDNVDVGTATASASYAGDANHEGSSGTATFVIGKASSTVTVSCPAEPQRYTSAPLEVCTASVSGAAGLSQALAVSYADNVNAGTATASASYAGDANHEASSGTATFEIGLAASEVTVTCPPSVVYTGGSQEVCTASTSGVGGLSQVLPVSYRDYHEVGTATASAIYAGDANHEGSSGSTTFEIVKAGSEVTLTCPLSVVYQGSAHEICTASVSGVGWLSQPLTVIYENHVNAGTATARADYAGDANHEGSSGSTTFVIGKAGSAVTLSCPVSVAYDGRAQQVCTASLSGVGGLSGTLAVTYVDNVNAGTAMASAGYAGDANHDGSSASTTFVIVKAGVFCTVVGWSGAYDGAAHGASGECIGVDGAALPGLDLGASYTFTPGGTAHWAFAGGENYESAGGDVEIVIEPGPGEATASGSDVEVAPVDPSTGTTPATITFESVTAAGSTSVVTSGQGAPPPIGFKLGSPPTYYEISTTASYDPPVRICISYGNSEFRNEQNLRLVHREDTDGDGVADTWVDITDEGYPDLESMTVCGTAISLSPFAVVEATVDAVVAPSEPVRLGTPVAVSSKYYPAQAGGSAIQATWTWGDGTTTTVTPTPDAPGTYRIDGVHAYFAAGTYAVTVEVFQDGTLAGSSTSPSVVVFDPATEVTVTCPVEVQPYDGAPIEPCTAVVTGALGLSQILTVSYAGNVNVGTATASASFAGDANHEGSIDTATFEIGKAGSAVTVICPPSVVYNGAPQQVCTASVRGVGGLSGDLTVDYTDNVDAGTATASASFAGDANHEGSSVTATFAIGKADALCTVAGYGGTYDGQPHGASGSCTGVDGGTLAGLDLGAVFTDVPGGTASWSFSGGVNYEDESGTAAIAIGKADALCAVTGYGGTYDGQPHGASGSCTGVDGGTLAGLDLGAVFTDVPGGTASWSFSGGVNYEDENGAVAITITPKALVGSVTAADKVYDGTTAATVLSRTLSGVIGGDAVSYVGSESAFDDKNVGTGKMVTVTGLGLTGPAAGNYTVNTVATTSAAVSRRDLIVSATGVDKVFDGTTTATALLSTDKVAGDDVTATYTAAAFADPDAGVDKPVGVAGIAIAGPDAANYTLLNTAAATTADITPATTNTTASVSASSVRYKDLLTLSATVLPLNTGGALTGEVAFTIGGASYGTATAVPVPGDANGALQATVVVQVSELPGNHAVAAAFTSTNANYTGSTGTTSLTVIPREASPYLATGFYTGDLFAWTTGQNSGTATVTLTAMVQDTNVPDGDLRAATVTFYLVNGSTLSPISGAKDVPVGLVDITDATVGTASAIVQLNIGSANSQGFQIAVGVSGGYRNNPWDALSSEIVTVAKPIPGGFIVGGGSLLNTNASGGLLKGAEGRRTGFQFDVQYNRKQTNPQGKAQVIVRSHYNADGILAGRLHTYVITSNAIAVLAVTPPKATFSSKANLVEQLEDGTSVAIEGGSILQLSMTDGNPDTLAISLQRKAGGLWFSSNWSSTTGKTIEQARYQGDLAVR